MFLLRNSHLDTWSKLVIQHFKPSENTSNLPVHQWNEIGTFTHTQLLTKKTKIFLTRSAAPVLDHILSSLLDEIRKKTHIKVDPFWPQLIFMDGYLEYQHLATFAIRDMTHLVEDSGRKREVEPKTDYDRLHQASRHAITVSELLEVSVKTLEHVVYYHKEFLEHTSRRSKVGAEVRETQNTLLFQSNVMSSMSYRCSTYCARMRNEIQLGRYLPSLIYPLDRLPKLPAFNLVSQDEARLSVELAKATKQDSQTMKVISALALLFLPPSYISGVFSTTFFQFGSDKGSWEVSERFWVYWVTVIPVTVVGIGVWCRFVYGGRGGFWGLWVRYGRRGRLGDSEM